MKGAPHITFDSPADGRRIFIGDVHGCCDELQALLSHVGYEERDVVVLVGDMVRKGPRSLDVIRLCREKKFLCVRGNHEEKIVRDQKKGVHHPDDVEWVQQMGPEDWEWLHSLPYSIDFPRDNILVVHAGVVPNKPLEDHTPFELTEMRFVGTDNQGLNVGTGERWAKSWHGSRTVVFGHDAVAGLQVEPFAYGLDTGAVYGKRLTALCVSNDGRRELMHHAAAKVYSKPTLLE